MQSAALLSSLYDDARCGGDAEQQAGGVDESPEAMVWHLGKAGSLLELSHPHPFAASPASEQQYRRLAAHHAADSCDSISSQEEEEQDEELELEAQAQDQQPHLKHPRGRHAAIEHACAATQRTCSRDAAHSCLGSSPSVVARRRAAAYDNARPRTLGRTQGGSVSIVCCGRTTLEVSVRANPLCSLLPPLSSLLLPLSSHYLCSSARRGAHGELQKVQGTEEGNAEYARTLRAGCSCPLLPRVQREGVQLCRMRVDAAGELR